MYRSECQIKPLAWQPAFGERQPLILPYLLQQLLRLGYTDRFCSNEAVNLSSSMFYYFTRTIGGKRLYRNHVVLV